MNAFDYPVSGVAVIIACCLLLFQRWWRKPHPKFPPGPRGIPLFGMLPFMGTFPARTLKQWAQEKYGPVMSVRLGSEDVVILTNWEVLNQALVKNSARFAGRPYIAIFNAITGDKGVLFRDYSEDWKSQKHFGLRVLREWGLGKKRMEDIVNIEGNYFLEFIRSTIGKPVDLKKYLFNVTGNIISQITWGARYEYDDVIYNGLLDELKLLFGDTEYGRKLFWVYYAPELRYLPGFKRAYNHFLERQYSSVEFMRERIAEHQTNFNRNDIRDFMDAFIFEQRHGTEINKKSFTDEQLVMYGKDMFLAGTETSSSTLAWAFLYLLHYPECLDPIEKEIETAFGINGVPSFSRRDETPYIMAYIQEIMRAKTLVTITLQHKTTDDGYLNEHFIPKNTTVIPCLWGAHMDPEIWPNPEQFDPYRHIDSNGKFVTSDKIVPFSMGQRFCPGEGLAKVEIYMFLIKILQKFKFRAPHKNIPTLDGIHTTMNVPTELNVVFEERY